MFFTKITEDKALQLIKYSKHKYSNDDGNFGYRFIVEFKFKTCVTETYILKKDNETLALVRDYENNYYLEDENHSNSFYLNLKIFIENNRLQDKNIEEIYTLCKLSGELDEEWVN